MQQQEEHLKKINSIDKQNIKISEKQQLGSQQIIHDHHHDQHCQHNNDNDNHQNNNKDKKKKKHTPKNYGIIIYCVFTCLSCFYLQIFCFHQFQDNQHKRRIKTFFTAFIVFMALWSYFQTIRIINNFPKLQGAPNITPNNYTDTNYLQKQCQQCQYYKPPLASHCSTCGTCIIKLDHHCIWAQNCIGYKNHKPFYLFTLYMSIGVCQFWEATYIVVGKLYGSCKFFSFFQPGVYVLWIITCFSALIVGIMILSLLFGHTVMILTNHTTLMNIKQKKVCPMPFCQYRSTFLNDQSINQYDRGEIQNIRNLFGNSILLAFLPFSRSIQHDFLFQPSHPIPSKYQIYNLITNQQQYQKCQLSIAECKQKYKQKRLKLNNKIYEIS